MINTNPSSFIVERMISTENIITCMSELGSFIDVSELRYVLERQIMSKLWTKLYTFERDTLE